VIECENIVDFTDRRAVARSGQFWGRHAFLRCELPGAGCVSWSGQWWLVRGKARTTGDTEEHRTSTTWDDGMERSPAPDCLRICAGFERASVHHISSGECASHPTVSDSGELL